MSEVIAKTLSEKQQRQSLSGPKKGTNKTVRNVLAKPYVGFWPLVDSQSESEMIGVLESFLPAACKVVSADDRKLLRGMQGKKMKESRDKLTQEIWKRNPGSRELRNYLALGVNDVSRGLEENTLASILISNEADPPILTRHLVTLAATRNVPHLVLQNLKATTKKCLDFSTLALGFKKTVADEEKNHFHPAHLKIESAFRMLARSSIVDAVPDNCNFVQEKNPSKTKQSTPAKKPYEIYLTRSSKKYRAFIPEKGLQKESNSAWSPYISLSTHSESAPVGRVTKEILGSTTLSETRSFLQKVRGAKEQSAQAMDCGSYVSLDPEIAVKGEEADVKVLEPVSQGKTVKRYFTSLAPLKIKRIQGNPMKPKKKQKGK